MTAYGPKYQDWTLTAYEDGRVALVLTDTLNWSDGTIETLVDEVDAEWTEVARDSVRIDLPGTRWTCDAHTMLFCEASDGSEVVCMAR